MTTVRLPGGAAVALLTPVDETGELDRAGLDRLVGHTLAGGVSMVCPVGSTGEGARLGARRRVEVTTAVCGLVSGAVPVVPGVPAGDLDSTLAELTELSAAGATAALVSPPSYLPMADDEVHRFYAALAAATPLPLLLYNIPQFTSVSLAPQVVGTLAEHPTVVGIKDSSRDMEYLLAVIEATAGAENFRVFTGTDTLLVAALVCGADGAIAASANVCPELGRQICASVAEGRLEDARSLQRRLTAVVGACRRGIPPAGWKTAAEVLGICRRTLVHPATPLSEQDRVALAEQLAVLGVVKEGQ
ncbi:dihydrodipicolinate synthase family protein [Streptomyces sp. NPDC058424]|uniref:dihydrodipicolinate synthase family protein n=1 Tax=Streptomyces sp. NPDC058424 TaxID=3346491 RepID=UPI003648D34C